MKRFLKPLKHDNTTTNWSKECPGISDNVIKWNIQPSKTFKKNHCTSKSTNILNMITALPIFCQKKLTLRPCSSASTWGHTAPASASQAATATATLTTRLATRCWAKGTKSCRAWAHGAAPSAAPVATRLDGDGRRSRANLQCWLCWKLLMTLSKKNGSRKNRKKTPRWCLSAYFQHNIAPELRHFCWKKRPKCLKPPGHGTAQDHIHRVLSLCPAPQQDALAPAAARGHGAHGGAVDQLVGPQAAQRQNLEELQAVHPMLQALAQTHGLQRRIGSFEGQESYRKGKNMNKTLETNHGPMSLRFYLWCVGLCCKKMVLGTP